MYLYEDGNEPNWMAGKAVRKQEGGSMTFWTERTVGISIAISGALVMLIALLATVDMVAYDGELRLGTWGFPQRMAVPTAICFMLLGSTLILIASLLKSMAERRK